MRNVKSFYVPDEFEPIYKVFGDICRREGESRSARLCRHIARDVAVHQPGNPQLPLEAFTGKAVYECFRCGGLKLTLQKVRFISGLEQAVCQQCIDEFYGPRRLIKQSLGAVTK